MLHRQEPLCAELRFDWHVGTFREAHFVVVVFHFLHESSLLEVFLYLLAHVHTVHAHIHSCGLAYCAVIVEYVDGLEVVFQSEGMVVDIVGRSHFQTARTKLYVNVTVFNYRYFSSHQRHYHVLSFEPCVFLIVWIYTHCRVTHDCFRARCGNHSVVAFLVFVHHVAFALSLHVAFNHSVFQIVEFRVFVFVHHLFV